MNLLFNFDIIRQVLNILENCNNTTKDCKIWKLRYSQKIIKY